MHCDNSSRLTWWQIPLSGAMSRKLENDSGPAKEAEALQVPVELDAGVERERVRSTGDVDHDRVVHDQSTGTRGSPIRSAAERRNGVAHRGEINHSGDAG